MILTFISFAMKVGFNARFFFFKKQQASFSQRYSRKKFSDLVDEGHIVYCDTYIIENSIVALTIDDIERAKSSGAFTFDLMEIHPPFLFLTRSIYSSYQIIPKHLVFVIILHNQSKPLAFLFQI